MQSVTSKLYPVLEFQISLFKDQSVTVLNSTTKFRMINRKRKVDDTFW